MRRRPNPPDPNQLAIDWAGSAGSARPPAPSGPSDIEQPSGASGALVQRLPWDFKTSFPEPLPQAIDAGVLDESDVTPEGLRLMHDAYAKTVLATLQERDRLSAARRGGIDPASGRKPTSAVGRERLRRFLSDAPERQQHAFDVLMLTYADAFGIDAADAFAKALNAWHAGIAVVAEGRAPTDGGGAPHPENTTEKPSRQTPPPGRRRSPSALPVPKPLGSAVRSGVFGHDQHGPVRPSPEEVRAITEQHADKLAELLVEAKRGRTTGGATKAFEAGVKAYADAFGTPAAERLRSYVERLSGQQRSCRSRRTR